MGCMGMSRDDFCRCTPSEFRLTWEAWSEREERRERSAWERARMECLCMLQPYSKNKLRAQDVMVFPWEKEDDGAAKADRPELSREEMMERYREAMRRRGLR